MAELRKRSEAAGTESSREDVRSATSRSVTIPGGDVGQPVEATWGDEFFQIVQYNGFRVGPFKATTTVREGETIASALIRLHAEINEAALVIRRYKCDSHIEELTRLGIGVR